MKGKHIEALRNIRTVQLKNYNNTALNTPRQTFGAI